ncbi:hypothetical protein HETIRDRAFT_326458 [Heterobasidion irregulare TC 32-1]|uniref:Uncharacterized protein n=1 Tax=Heterobasidion irregulare (strain TC 32-1) TaxID=747525 RepID=W4JU89_HETIT|nr:uncharacterized protein HETIRDRAFT_326458 [Heterobasidion irregulare TC 32-1]ETW77029.1 hypothetical protein HETIRDRAFT_326458 [Heterobasidion irregulare TC 32-1]
MCYREVGAVRFACGHEEPQTFSQRDCGRTNCRYSASHVVPCNNCSSTCAQWYVPFSAGDGLVTY